MHSVFSEAVPTSRGPHFLKIFLGAESPDPLLNVTCGPTNPKFTPPGLCLYGVVYKQESHPREVQKGDVFALEPKDLRRGIDTIVHYKPRKHDRSMIYDPSMASI